MKIVLGVLLWLALSLVVAANHPRGPVQHVAYAQEWEWYDKGWYVCPPNPRDLWWPEGEYLYRKDVWYLKGHGIILGEFTESE